MSRFIKIRAKIQELFTNRNFNIYSVEWSSEKMVFSVNDTIHYEYNPLIKNKNCKMINKNGPRPIVFDHAMKQKRSYS